jgi:NAD(P)-dependent dehydrogenase (short-subunit alcohol dehydrogenase family)
VANWEGGRRVIATAVETFGGLHILVNNAGILHDRVLVNMTEDDWDSVMRVHLRGTLCQPGLLLRTGASEPRRASRSTVRSSTPHRRRDSSPTLVKPTTAQQSPGWPLHGDRRQGASRYDVRVNAIAPVARTRLTLSTPGLEERIAAPANPDAFDEWDPANISPLVAWLSTEECDVSGRVFLV